MHRKIKHYLKENFDLYVSRECYLKNAIEFEVDKSDVEKISGLTKFTVDNIEFEKRPKLEEKNAITVFVIFNYKYLDNDTYAADITAGGFKKYGVINPEGVFYECCYSGHDGLNYILKERGLIEDSPNKYRHNSFEWWGWMTLSGASFIETEFNFPFEISDYDYETKKSIVEKANLPTDAQIDKIVEYIKSLGREYFMFNGQWHHIDEAERFKGLKNHEDYLENVRYRDGLEELDLGREELNKQR